MKRSLVALLLLGVAIAGTASGQARLWDKPGPCDRDCLKGVVDKYVQSREKPVETLADAEEDQIRRVLAATGGNKSKAAQVLGIERIPQCLP